jgi:hypothetical protein
MVPPLGEHDPPRAREVEAEAKEPVVRSDEVVPPGLDGDRPARPADAGIHDREVHRAAREDPPHALQEEGAALDVLRGHRVRQVDQPRPGVDREEDTLDRADVGVVVPEVGQQRDDAVWAARGRAPTPPHRSRWITYSAMSVRISRAGEAGTRSSAAAPVAA